MISKLESCITMKQGSSMTLNEMVAPKSSVIFSAERAGEIGQAIKKVWLVQW